MNPKILFKLTTLLTKNELAYHSGTLPFKIKRKGILKNNKEKPYKYYFLEESLELYFYFEKPLEQVNFLFGGYCDITIFKIYIAINNKLEEHEFNFTKKDECNLAISSGKHKPIERITLILPANIYINNITISK